MITVRLSDLLQGISATHVRGPVDAHLLDVQFDSRSCQPGSVFIARRGQRDDGHKHIADAVTRGASAVIVEAVPEGAYTRDAAVYKVADSRVAMSLMAQRLYEFPAHAMKLIAVTGTNGKTTTTYLVEAMLRAAGVSPGVIGTVSYRYADRVIPAGHTTPEAITLQRVLRQMLEAGVGGVAMEASSIAIDQERLAGMAFDVAAFTNITRDHLDYHKTFENYFEAKRRLFTELLAPNGTAVINRDDPYGTNLAAILEGRTISTSVNPDASTDIRPLKCTVDFGGIRADVRTPVGTLELTSPLLGRFNLANLMVAVGIGVAMKLPLDKIAAGLATCHGAPGRMEGVPNAHDVRCLVDYAHTPDALERVLAELRAVKRARLIAVFGCGGDRDRGKRPQMGQAAGDLADITIVTSDNPRTENPNDIIDDILPGVRSTGVREIPVNDARNAATSSDRFFTVVPDRRAAIHLAIALAKPGDIVLLAGKGHEDYQEINGIRHNFSDRDEALAAFSNKETA